MSPACSVASSPAMATSQIKPFSHSQAHRTSLQQSPLKRLSGPPHLAYSGFGIYYILFTLSLS